MISKSLIWWLETDQPLLVIVLFWTLSLRRVQMHQTEHWSGVSVNACTKSLVRSSLWRSLRGQRSHWGRAGTGGFTWEGLRMQGESQMAVQQATARDHEFFFWSFVVSGCVSRSSRGYQWQKSIDQQTKTWRPRSVSVAWKSNSRDACNLASQGWKWKTHVSILKVGSANIGGVEHMFSQPTWDD